MYRIVDGVKTPYNVLSAREALETSLNDVEREEFCKIIDDICEKALDNGTSYIWYYDLKRRWDKNNRVDDSKILALLKYYGYLISPGTKTESGLYVYGIFWNVWED